MSQQNELNEQKKDDQLADFADKMLEGKIMKTASIADDEMAALEETLLRLNRSLPSATLSDAEKKQMLVRFKARLRREEAAEKPSFWKRLFDLQANPQLGIALAAVAVLVLVVIGVPMLGSTSTETSGTANSTDTGLIAIGMIGILLMVYWFSRKK